MPSSCSRRLVALLFGSVLFLPGLPAPDARATGTNGYSKDLSAFFDEVDRSYPFFDLKGIRKDWAKTKRELTKRVRGCRSDDDFLRIVFDAVMCLRDAHMSVRPKSGKYPEWPKRYYPGLVLMPASEDRVVVMYPPPGLENTLPTGTIVTTIDGKPARKVMEERAEDSWKEGGFFSSPQRARLFVYRVALEGEKGETHTLGYRSVKREKKITVRCDREVKGWAHTYNLPKHLVRVGRSCFFTQLEDKTGYMYWRRIDGSIEEGIGKARKAHPDAKGFIVDLRGNGGGGYGRSLIEKVKALPRPVAAIIDAGCISAGETMARDLVHYAGAKLFGTTTAGASSSKRQWEFPSGIASVILSTRSRGGIGGRPIEFHGIDPDVEVEPVPAEVLAGKNSAILRADEYIRKEVRGHR